MIDTLLNAIGYSGEDTVVTYIVVTFACILVCCLAYALFDFLTSLVTTLCGRNKKS